MLLVDASVPVGTWLPPHRHAHQSLMVVLSGGFRERVDNVDLELGKGSLCLRPVSTHHAHVVGAELTRWLAIELIDRPEIALGATLADGRPMVIRNGNCSRIGSRIARTSWEQHPAYRLRLESLLLELLACVALRGGASGTPPSWLQQVHDQLWANFRDPPSMESLAAAAGVHQSHLLRRFRHHYGLSPTAQVRRWKAECARALLATPGASLSAVAFEAGFADQSHMGRVLRSIYGTTPGRLQRETAMVGSPTNGAPQTPPLDPLPLD